ncbi:hypothetical protein [Nocardioides solisilvae]|uniref:hypothetical protein n=1 Tax=Nocardioides solisilvae TaxID=1542435 RepID=UPI000D74045A|nr:hypothetical protein [Nocardioides solisilvae]
MPRTRLVRRLCAVLLVTAAATACGGEEETAGPSVEDRYCEAYQEFFAERAEHDMETTDAEVVATLKEWGTDLVEIGAPESMPEGARRGHATWSRLISEVDDDAEQADVVALEAELTERQMAEVEEFFAYNDATCLGSRQTGVPQESPTP